MTWMRIKLDQVDSEEPSPLIITAPIGHDKCIEIDIPLAGWWGLLKPNAWLRPVIFKTDGTVEFGGDPDDDPDERRASLQVFGVPFEIGKDFYMEDHELKEVSRFVVREMTSLKG